MEAKRSRSWQNIYAKLEFGESKDQKTEELICEWRKFKYSILKLKSEIPADVVKLSKNKVLTSQTATGWLLHCMLSHQSIHNHFVPQLLPLPLVHMALPVATQIIKTSAVSHKHILPLPQYVPEKENTMVQDEISVADLEKEVDFPDWGELPVDLSDMNDSHSDYDPEF